MHYSKPIIEFRNPECRVDAHLQPCGHHQPCFPQQRPNIFKFKHNRIYGAPAAAQQVMPVTSTMPAFVVATVPIMLQTTTFGFGATGANFATGVNAFGTAQASVAAQDLELLNELRSALVSELIESVRASRRTAADSTGATATAATATAAGGEVNARIANLESEVQKLRVEVQDIKARLQRLCQP